MAVFTPSNHVFLGRPLFALDITAIYPRHPSNDATAEHSRNYATTVKRCCWHLQTSERAVILQLCRVQIFELVFNPIT
jgi:hypothetical protein